VNSKSNFKSWSAFLFLGILGWGMSFLWIKVALRELGPVQLVTWRMAFGAVGSWLIILLRKERITVRGKELIGTLLLGAFYSAIPITMISWAEMQIDSGLAGIINATTPLFTILFAHFFLHDEKITPSRLSGFVAGFAGVVLLLSGDLGPHGLTGGVWGQLAVMTAAMMYGMCIVYARRYLKGQNPLHTSAILMTGAFTTMLILSAFAKPHFVLPHEPLTWLACVWMGVLGLSLAYVSHFYLINHWGATRAALVTYVVPVTAVSLGVIFLGEHPEWYVFAGGTLVIGGIALVNAKIGMKDERPKLP
jgi:drug/metabolite transporter (DMT)-like permease